MAEISDTSRTSAPDEHAGFPYPDFKTAAHEVLRLLQGTLKLRLWMITRAVDRDNQSFDAARQDADRAMYEDNQRHRARAAVPDST